ncbi:MAG: hypothetical protein ACLP8X_34290 [Streptosporangiaceae bacterium]
MTLDELMELASEARENLGGDAEVRIASQPGWPLRAALACVTIPHSTDPSDLYGPDEIATGQEKDGTFLWLATGDLPDRENPYAPQHRELFALLAGVFAQARSRLTAFAYVGALLAEPRDRRSCWQLAEAAGHATPRRMQALLAEHARDWEAALAGTVPGRPGLGRVPAVQGRDS